MTKANESKIKRIIEQVHGKRKRVLQYIATDTSLGYPSSAWDICCECKALRLSDIKFNLNKKGADIRIFSDQTKIVDREQIRYTTYFIYGLNAKLDREYDKNHRKIDKDAGHRLQKGEN